MTENMEPTTVAIYGIFLKSGSDDVEDFLVAQAFKDPRKPSHYIDELCLRKIHYLAQKNGRFRSEYYYKPLNNSEVDQQYEGIV